MEIDSEEIVTTTTTVIQKVVQQTTTTTVAAIAAGGPSHLDPAHPHHHPKPSHPPPSQRTIQAPAAGTNNPIKIALLGVPAQSYFLHADKVITLQSREKIPAAVQILVDYGISSAPVLDDAERCIGLFDMADVLDFVLKIFEETKPLGDNFMAQLEQTTRMCIEPCSSIVGSSKRDKYCPVSINTPLIDAILLLDTHNLHRVPVVDGSGQITSLITQSGVLQWFAYNMERLGDVRSKTVQELLLGFRPVVMINGNEPAINAFQLMEKRGISSVAVVDNELKLLAVVSTSDLKGVTRDPILISRLHLPILSYLALLHPDGTQLPVVCSVNDTVEHVITTLVAKKVHRVYLVDSNNSPPQTQQPVGVISLRDMIHALLQEDFSNYVV